MMIDLLKKQLDVTLDASDGVERLRELILIFAVQGKLVRQDDCDRDSHDAIKEAEIEKQRLIKEKKIKKPKPVDDIKPNDIPYDIPSSWSWVRLGTIGEINPRNSFEDDADAGFVPMPLIHSEYGKSHELKVRKWSEIKKGYTHFSDGDVGLAKITPCFENGKSCIFQNLPNGVGAGTTELHIFRDTFGLIFPPYLLAYLKNSKYIASNALRMTGSAGQKRVSTSLFVNSLLPLPPLAEQKRIVAKIDQLMARCDELEKPRAERDRLQISVHKAACDRLLTAPDTDSFKSSWQFITKHFSELYSVKENVTELRKVILQLAAMGKLVPQQKTDPLASELLDKIVIEKQKLVKEKKIKKPKSFPPLTEQDIPYELPKSWDWIRLVDLSKQIDYGTSQKANTDSSNVPVYRMGNIVDGQLVDDNFKYVSSSIDDLPRLYLQPNDILFNRTNSYELVGKTALYKGQADTATFASYLIRVKLFEEYLFPAYFSLVMNAPYFRRTQIEPEIVQQCGQANFNGTKLSSTAIPLPPLPEQHRIVAKVNQLMTLCDTLEQQIDATTQTQTALLNAITAQV